MRPSRLWISLLAILACTANPDPVPRADDAELAPVKVEHTEPAEARLQIGTADAAIPSGYRLASDEYKKKLVEQYRETEFTEVELAAAQLPPGQGRGVVQIVSQYEPRLGPIYGQTIAQRAKLDRDGITQLLESQFDTSVEFTVNSPSIGGQPPGSTTYEYRAELEGGQIFWARVRSHATEEGHTHLVLCTCAGTVCDDWAKTCKYAAAPATTLPIDAPIYGRQEPIWKSVSDESVSVRVPPFYGAQPAAQVARLEADQRRFDPRIGSIDSVSHIAKDPDVGSILIQRREWCRKPGQSCSPKEVSDSLRRVMASEAAAQGEAPWVIVAPLGKKDGDPPIMLETRSGIVWQRRLISEEPDGVVERLCICGGPGCPVAEASCRFGPPGESADGDRGEAVGPPAGG